ncbi:hypothetical protein N0V83_009341 [Neocucurbitaria cava]|uniref:Uncharacterized protein n=1 Tax=Neocucurbitaria cava TaxID=798079 RepID=A0A9W9CIC1_9PLEO|nr:hypothetical protein N0V83_009341 [Neocucurbitaria cava]
MIPCHQKQHKAAIKVKEDEIDGLKLNLVQQNASLNANIDSQEQKHQQALIQLETHAKQLHNEAIQQNTEIQALKVAMTDKYSLDFYDENAGFSEDERICSLKR